MEFSELNLHPDIKRGVDEAGYLTCMPVQEQVFPHAFSGEDIYAQSQTGTGKTAAFLLSIFQRMMTDPESRTRKTLIITPTRELAAQIEDEARKLGKYLDIKMGTFYGGMSYGPQLELLRDDVQMIIGTPGRIIDLLQQGKMKLNEVGFLVVDEADRMFDMGFIDDIRKLMRYLPPPSRRQTFLFSATLGMRIKDLAWEWMRAPKEIAIEPEHVTVDLVTQELYHVGSHEKFSLLLGILDRERPQSALIFCNQKFMVEEIARRLQVNGVDCDFIMGDLPQSKRQAIIDSLKGGKLEILVATDVASRGLDVQALDLVVNYDVPEEAESYVHRIGRTARAGKAGKAVTFACEKFVFNLPAIEKFIGNKIPVAPFDTSLLLHDRSANINWRRAHEHDRSRPREGGDARGAHGRRGGDGRGGYEDRGGRMQERPESEQRDGRRQGAKPRDAAPQTAAGAPSGAERDNARQNPRGPTGGESRPGQAVAGRGPADPYAVPQDERIQRYRDGYSGSDSRASGPGAGRRRDAPAGTRPSGQSAASGQGRETGGRGTAGTSPAASHGTAGGRGGAGMPRPQPKTAGAESGPAIPRAPRRNAPATPGPSRESDPSRNPAGGSPRKPGFIARLKTIFGGKKD